MVGKNQLRALSLLGLCAKSICVISVDMEPLAYHIASFM